MSKKKIFALICLFIFTSWGLVSLYYYNKHVVTVKEYKVGEKIEVSEGIVIIHNIEIHDFERRHFSFNRLEWFYNSVLPKIPVKLQPSAMRAIAFYSERYNSDLGVDDLEGRIMYVYCIYVSNKGKYLFDDDRAFVNVIAENGTILTHSSGGYMRNEGSNFKLFHSSGKFFLNEYSPASDDSLIINVKDQLINESHEIIIQPVWETSKYNFFNNPPAEYSFSPDVTVSRFLRAVVYNEDLSTAEGLMHPQINDFPWENLEHNEWSRSQGRITQYIGRYLEFDDVFSTRITFIGSDDEIADTVFVQKIYMINYEGEWRIIDVSPLTRVFKLQK